jgi:biotin carboxyl carrier protein
MEMIDELRTLRVQVDGRTYVVSVEQAGKEKVRATLGNVAYECESPRGDGISKLVIRSSKDEVRAYTKRLHGHRVDVWVAGLPFPTSVEAVGVAGYTAPAEAVAEKRVGGEIRALMPGRITSILVKEGDSVGAGSPLLILEAMKMQNEIVAPIAGRVKEVKVQEGAAVMKYAILIVVE